MPIAIALLSANVALVLAIVKLAFFRDSLTTTDYLFWVTDQVSVWTGRLVWLSGVILFVVVPLARRRPVRIPEVSELTQTWLNAAGRRLASRKWSRFVVGVNAVAFIGLAGGLYASLRLPAPPVAGRVVIPTDARSTKMYVLSGNSVTVYDRAQVTDSGELGRFQTYTLADAGDLRSIAVTYDLQRVFVSDRQTGQIHVLNGADGREEAHLAAGRTVNALALTADGQKLYAAVVGPIPQGQILAYDASTLESLGSIRGVGCPMSLAVARSRLFVATQCGGGHDPVYVIDTRSDRIARRLPDFAVGDTVVATADGERIIVSTGDAVHLIRDYMADKPDIRTITRPAGRMALTPDNRLVIVASANSLIGVDVERAAECRTATLESGPQAITVAPDGAVFALLAARLFTTDAQALECE